MTETYGNMHQPRKAMERLCGANDLKARVEKQWKDYVGQLISEHMLD
jgi:hypothetical protein